MEGNKVLHKVCIICCKEDDVENLSELRDDRSWTSLYSAAQIRQFKPILDTVFCVSESQIFYHRRCRQNFTHKKDLDKLQRDHSQDTPSTSRCSSRDTNLAAPILPNNCIFCQKEKYLKGTRTRECLNDCSEFRADDKVRNSATLHVKTESTKSGVANRILGICSKDLISSEGKYHKSCYRDFVRIKYEQPKSTSEQSISTGTEKEQEIENIAFVKVISFCEELIAIPKVIEFAEITQVMVNEVNRLGSTLRESSKKNLMRKVSNTFSELKFVSASGRKVLVYPSTLHIEALALEIFWLKNELQMLSPADEEKSTILRAANILRRDILDNPQRLPWPPSTEDLLPEKVSLYVPAKVDMFYNTVLSGSVEESGSARVLMLKNSYAQDVVYGVTRGTIKTPKSVLMSSVIKSLCNNTEVIRLINKHGHGVSYDIIEELDTEYALDTISKQKDGKVIIPRSITASEDSERDVALIVSDNIDNLESTLSGAGTSHRVNSILILKRKANDVISDVREEDDSVEPKVKRRRRLPEDLISQDIPEYYGGKREGPGELKMVHDLEKGKRDKKWRMQRLQYLVWLSARMILAHHSLLVPSWTGFNIIVRDNVVVVKSLIGYLDTVDSPATDVKTAFEVLCRACAVRDRLNLASVVCVFDQAFYAKASEVFWKHKDMFKNIVLMLGGFHLLMMLMGIIGTRFADAGLREIAVQSGVVAGGSLDSVLAGKHYNRAIRLHKIVYEALMRLLLDAFKSSIISSAEDTDTIDRHNKLIEDFKMNMCQDQYESLLQSRDLEKWYGLFDNFLNTLQETGGDLITFWMSYIELCELTLNLIFATRTGDWDLYLACIAEVIPWAFAYDRQNYAKYLIPFLNDMRNLATTMPAVHAAFQNGEFAVQMSESNTFGANEPDKTIENTINRDCKTSGGYIGFSVDFSATQRWVLNASRRGEYRKLLREHLAVKPSTYIHKELTPSRIQRDNEETQQVIHVLENVLANPWNGGELTSLSTGVEASGIVLDHLLNAQKYGVDACNSFVSSRCVSNSTKEFFDPLPKLKLKTFSNLIYQAKTSTKNKVISLKLDRALFARMALLGQYRKIDLKTVFSFPLGPLPWSLADEYSQPRKTNKAQLLNHLTKDTTILESYPQNAVSIYDGMAVLQKFKPPTGATFGVLAQKIFETVTSTSSKRVDVVFDVYRDISIKNAERGHRSHKTDQTSGVIYKNIIAGYPIKSWSKFLIHASNKTEVVKFLSQVWQTQEFLDKLKDRVMFVTSGSECWKLTSSEVESVTDLLSTQEEADTRLLLHAMHASQTHVGPIVVHADDTDVFILLLSHSAKLNKNIVMKVGTGSKRRIIDIDAVIRKLKNIIGNEIDIKDLLQSLLGLHALTGCDTVSALCGKGKLKPLKLLMVSPKYVKALLTLGTTWDTSEETLTTIEAFVCEIYGKKICDVNLLRYQLHCATAGKIEPQALPPCQSSLHLHVNRANYQAAIWRRALLAEPDVPLPHGHGWQINDGQISIKWLNSSPAPDEILEFLSCNCKKCTVDNCCCLKAGLKCTDMCKVECDNMVSENDNIENAYVNDDEEGDDD